MRLLIAKSTWEISGDPLDRALKRIADDGYDVVELPLLNYREDPARVRSLLREIGLPAIVHITSGDGTIDDHLRALEERYLHGLSVEPLFFNCHTGGDFLSFEDNCRMFERAAELSARHGVRICHETHRGRALFSLPETMRYLQAMPDLRLTADLSHWFCVHESDLVQQQADLDVVLERVDHVHARVGFAEGPQVSDPRNPHYEPWLKRSMMLWRSVVDRARSQGHASFTITPEFGPIGYLPLRGREPVGVADPWEINGWMRDLLRTELA